MSKCCDDLCQSEYEDLNYVTVTVKIYILLE